MEEVLYLNKLKIGEIAKVKELTLSGAMRRHLLDIGLISNTFVQCLQESPFADPRAYLIRGAVIAIRDEDAKNVILHNCTKEVNYAK